MVKKRGQASEKTVQRGSTSFDCKTHVPLAVVARSGQTYCFNCIVEEHQTQVFNLALHMLSDWALAEDATQEAFLSAFQSFQDFRGKSLRAWLLSIIANTCRDMLRTRKRRPSVPLEEIALKDPSQPVSRKESPEDYALRRELGRLIQQGIAILPQEQRLALVLIDIDGMSYEEAAQAMRCSLGTVKSRLSRARVRMRDFLRPHGELLPHELRQDK